MSVDGMDFGAHTLSHPNLSELPLKQAEKEIIEAKTIIQNQLGKEIRFFSYPYGKRKKEIQNIVEDEFSCACSDKLGFTYVSSDPYFLPRIDMYYFARNDFFKRIHTPFVFLYIKFRNALRLLRNQI